jgi:hypothetical protein
VSYWVVIYRTGWIALAGLGLVGASVAFVPKWKEYRDYQRRNAEMAREEALEQEMLNLLKSKQERFRTDPRFVVRIAHDLGLARSNEVIFRYQGDAPPPPAVTTSPPRPPPSHRPAASSHPVTQPRPRPATTPRPTPRGT